MRHWVLGLALGLLMLGVARADYMLGDFDSCMPTITVVDAVVTGFTAEGHALLAVNAVVQGGRAQARITGVYMSCTGGTPRDYGMQAGVRYLIFLRGKDLYEESSYFELAERDGELKFRTQHGYWGWFDKTVEWQSLAELKARIGALAK